MSWQKCPACCGTGGYELNPCSVCKGFKIIDELTGRPPNPPPAVGQPIPWPTEKP